MMGRSGREDPDVRILNVREISEKKVLVSYQSIDGRGIAQRRIKDRQFTFNGRQYREAFGDWLPCGERTAER